MFTSLGGHTQIDYFMKILLQHHCVVLLKHPSLLGHLQSNHLMFEINITQDVHSYVRDMANTLNTNNE